MDKINTPVYLYYNIIHFEKRKAKKIDFCKIFCFTNKALSIIMLIMANWGLAELRLAEAVRVTEDQTDAREGTAEVLDF